MEIYTSNEPVFSESINITTEGDLVNADNDAAAVKQLLDNTLVNAYNIAAVSQDEDNLNNEIQEIRQLIDLIYTNANGYTDNKIAQLISGAPSTLDTLGEIARAMQENDTVVDALEEAIGRKANAAEFNSHEIDNVKHITTTERNKWNSIDEKISKSGGTMIGALNLANGTWNAVGDDVAIGDHNMAGGLGVKGLNGNTRLDFVTPDGSGFKSIEHDGSDLVIDGIGIRDLYNRVVALESTANRRFTQIINLTAGYDPNIWYPVVGSDIPQAGMRYLNAYTLLYQCKPSWSTHAGGYSCNITMLVNGSGWGANKENMNLCLNQVCAWTQNNGENPVSFSNLLQSQTPVLYCRGGGYYTVVTDWESTWTPITTSYTKNDQTVVPVGSSPRVNIDGASGSVVYGKDRYITKNNQIENNTFTDELVHNGFWKLGDFADANYAASIGIDENTGDFYAIVFNYYGAGDSHTMGFGNVILLSPRLGTKFYFIQVWNKSLHVKKFG